MLRSMTTFSCIEYSEDSWSCVMELKSVNGRFCDIHIKSPKWMNPIEDRIKRLVQDRMIRGRIDLSVQYEDTETKNFIFEPNLELARSYLNAVKSLGDGLGLEGTMDLSMLLNSLNDVITINKKGPDVERVWERIENQLEKLLDQAIAMSVMEGSTLEKDLKLRLCQIEQWVKDISGRAEECLEKVQQAFKERILSILKDVSVDEGRLLQELTILADKLDITEELVRINSHIGQFKEIFDKEGAIGRKMDFLLQELFRETNTIASKSCDSTISGLVVEIKVELEKMREQVQNVI
jgi:uncharacterized protein (TIGR00255 family)